MGSSSLGTVASKQEAAACTGPNASVGWDGMKQGGTERRLGTPKPGLAFPLLTNVANDQDSITSMCLCWALLVGKVPRQAPGPVLYFCPDVTRGLACAAHFNLFPPAPVFLACFECCLHLTGCH